MNISETRRLSIAELLKSRRSKMQPEDVGLPRGKRRRTPGLRREEIATLAGVSTEWYTWLEQGRDIRASAETLRRISRVLRLEPSEEALLLRLSGHSLETLAPGSQSVRIPDHLQALLDQQYPFPAFITGPRLDFLAWNEPATLLFGDLDHIPVHERNTLFNLFKSKRYREILIDWEYHARGMVSKLQAMTPEWEQDPWFSETIARIREESVEFQNFWIEKDVRPFRDGFKSYLFPEVGKLSFNYSYFKAVDDTYRHLNIILYTPTDIATETRLHKLLDQTSGSKTHPPTAAARQSTDTLPD